MFFLFELSDSKLQVVEVPKVQNNPMCSDYGLKAMTATLN